MFSPFLFARRQILCLAENILYINSQGNLKTVMSKYSIKQLPVYVLQGIHVLKTWRKHMGSALATNWAIKPSGSWSHCEFFNIPVEGVGMQMNNKRSSIWTAEKDMNLSLIDHRSYVHNFKQLWN